MLNGEHGETPPLSPASLPCEARRSIVARLDLCCCGKRSAMVDVYECATHGRCTLQATGKPGLRVSRWKVVACVACLAAREMEAAAVSAAPAPAPATHPPAFHPSSA